MEPYDNFGPRPRFAVVVSLAESRTLKIENKLTRFSDPDIIEQLSLQDRVQHWTFGEHFGHGKVQQKALLTELRKSLQEMNAFGATLVLYQAGADPHIDDPLG